MKTSGAFKIVALDLMLPTFKFRISRLGRSEGWQPCDNFKCT